MHMPARMFVSRQHELCERLRWAPVGSKRRKKLEAELARLVREELERETGKNAKTVDDKDEQEPRRSWWQQ
jgi:hypothetical protein